MVLEAGVPVPYMVRGFTRTKLPDWRAGRFPSLSKGPHSIIVSLFQHFLGVVLSCLHSSSWTGFLIYTQIHFVLFHIQKLLVLYSFLVYPSATYLLAYYSSLLTLGSFMFLPYNCGRGSLCLISTFCFEIKHKSLPPGGLSTGRSWEVGDGPVSAAVGTQGGISQGRNSAL